MKKRLLVLFLMMSMIGFAQQQTVSVSVAPNPFDEDDSITITFDGSTINEATWGVTDNALYLWAWSYDLNDANSMDSPTNGTWTNSNEANRLTYNSGDDTYTITFVPSTFYARTGIGRMGFLLKAQDGTGDKKSQDTELEVGTFQLNLTSPTESVVIDSPGAKVSIAATATMTSNFTLKANGVTVDTQNAIMSYAYTHTLTETTTFVLEANNGTDTLSETFQVVAAPTPVVEAIPAGLAEGINYSKSDNTKATLVLRAPFKDLVYVAGSFNGYVFDDNYVMKQDTNDSELFWFEVTGLTPGTIYTYQYWVIDETPVANSPKLVKTADPYSPLVLSPFDDPGIPSGSYPNLPAYPSGQEREVTVLQTNQPVYNWTVTNFVKPKKEDLVIYELLIRDFDADRNYQDVIDRIDHLKNLNINAIQLMPVMEFDGNETWGYNTSFHMALDKFYGTQNKFKELVDLCHQNGIAVILDIALNHATGRNPLVRMWMDDPDEDGWGGPSSENPFFNTVPQHDYNVFNDFNHQSTYTQNYTRRIVQHWIQEYQIDGFRWDLTKGFTQNCGPGSPAGCTDTYQQDRIDVLKGYSDYSWSLDPTHYVIFEHLGPDNEEQQWANYRLNETPSKGIMMWGKMTNEYTDFMQGFSSNISRATHTSRGFNEKRLIAYPESHDEERVMYETLTFGSSSVRNLAAATKRMSSLGAIYLTMPGPKMIWHFAEFGMDDSIWTCNNGTVQNGNDGCKLATKPQPQWAENWSSDANRSQTYDDWAKLIDLRINEDVFEGDFVLEGTTQNVRMFIFDLSLPAGSLRNVVVLANFNTTTQNITPDFPFTGTWYNLMDNTSINVASTTDPISIPAGEFRIFGNEASTLSTTDENLANELVSLYPNPANTNFYINSRSEDVIIYNVLGKEVASFRGSFQENKSFSIENLESGVYFVKANTEKGNIVKRLIKE